MTLIKKLFHLIVLLFISLAVYNHYSAAPPLQANTKITKLVVYKSKRQLISYADGKVVKTYTIALGASPIGDKEYEGDKKTPESSYIINDKNPNSQYHKNLGISYPSLEDKEQAKQLGKSAGGDIKIHGLPNRMGYIGKLHSKHDWTLGCIAVTNNEIDELYRAVEIGTPIDIKP